MKLYSRGLVAASLLIASVALGSVPPLYVEFVIATGASGGDLDRVVVELRPDWAPLGAARVLELVEAGFYQEARFFRVLPKFMAQFGMHADPKVHARWQKQKMLDDPVVQPNDRGTVSFAMSGKNTRTTQLFINTVNNRRLDKEGFAPVGRVVSGMDAVDRINDQHRELPNQGKIFNRGNGYLVAEFPNLSYIVSTRVVGPGDTAGRTLVECWVLGAAAPLRLDVQEEWAPLGAGRFLDLVDSGFYDGAAVFRAVPGFLAQFGLPPEGSPARRRLPEPLRDDPPAGVPFARGALALAGSGPATRDAQAFFALAHLGHLGSAAWERPFGFVERSSLPQLDAIYTGYGEVPRSSGPPPVAAAAATPPPEPPRLADPGPAGLHGPDPARLSRAGGSSYLQQEFPLISYLDYCAVVAARGWESGPGANGSAVTSSTASGMQPNASWALSRRWPGPRARPARDHSNMPLGGGAHSLFGMRLGGRSVELHGSVPLWAAAVAVVAILVGGLIGVMWLSSGGTVVVPLEPPKDDGSKAL